MRRFILCVGIIAILLQASVSASTTPLKCYSCGGRMTDCEKNVAEQTCSPGQDVCQVSMMPIAGFEPSDYKPSNLAMTPDGKRILERLCTTSRKCENKKKRSKLYTVTCCKDSLCN
ncbi:uncharacterized protein O3C94_019216 [Discoglossus pictus]